MLLVQLINKEFSLEISILGPSKLKKLFLEDLYAQWTVLQHPRYLVTFLTKFTPIMILSYFCLICTRHNVEKFKKALFG